MSDLIDRQAAIDAIKASSKEIQHWLWEAEGCESYCEMVADVETCLDDLPSAQPQRMKGRWYHGDAYPHHLYCSVCYRTALPNDEYVERWNLHMNYCPNCGADMRGDEYDG